jgi:hypothetical protein
MENKYIIDQNEYCGLPIQSITQNITYQYLSTGSSGNQLVGFNSLIENTGCTGNITTQENHVLEVSGGLVSPKNIVLRTDGNGSFLRDDFLTVLKGDIRGLGANDLSISRTSCDRVASGNYSVITGGENNRASGSDSVVGGGSNNLADAIYSSIVGGSNNQLPSTATYSFIGGGRGNTASGENTVIVGGSNNLLSSTAKFSFIGGGELNTVSGSNAVIVGGGNNQIDYVSPNTNIGNFIGGGFNNLIRPNTLAVTQNASVNFIGGGSNNTVIGNQSVVVGGEGNTAGAGQHNFIGGGINNSTFNSAIQAQSRITIVGGSNNFADSGFSFIGGGANNSISTVGTSTSIYSLIVGGQNNTIGDRGVRNSVIVGGTSNRIVYTNSVRSNMFIGGGTTNTITNAEGSTICGGVSNSINSGASNSAIPGGIGLVCSQTNTCAVGAYNTPGSITTTGQGFTATSGLTGINVSAQSRIFMVGAGTVGSTNNAFCVTADGHAIARRGFLVSTSADFAEYLESDYQIEGVYIKIPIGTTVVLNDNGFIMPSNTLGLEDKPVIGVVSATSCLSANCQLEEWKGKYLHENGIYLYDEIQEYEEEIVYQDITRSDRTNPCKMEVKETFQVLNLSGEVISTRNIPKKIRKPVYEKEYLYTDVSETVLVENFNYETKQIQLESQIVYKKIPINQDYDIFDESGNYLRTETIHQFIETNPKKRLELKLNPSFNPSQNYIPRPNRPEWNLIGLIGQVYIKNDQRTNPNWLKIKDINEDTSLWIIK